MQNIYKDQFVTLFFDKKNSLMLETWHTATQDMTEDQFKNYLRVWSGLMIENEVKYVFSNMTNSRFLISPKLQMWLVENITPLVNKYGLFEKHAFLKSNNFLADLALEQFIDENNDAKTGVIAQCFDHEKDAMEWLFS